MDKREYIIDLFDDIKDEIQFDCDVVALATLLGKLLEFQAEESFQKWSYLIQKYDIPKLSLDIDFLPLIQDYPNQLLKKIGFESFFKFMSELPLDRQQLVYRNLFNIYDSNSYLYQSLDYYIKKNNYQDEKKLIDIFLDKKKIFFKGTFDQVDFIRRVILLHLTYKENISLSFLQELIETVENKKDKAILKTLMIDYI